tara:strand:+ start:304 stop:474 length:171 start_codon:yes stop_codon:yes gene_type:complete
MEIKDLIQYLQQLLQLVVDMVDQEQVVVKQEATADLAEAVAEALTIVKVETETPHL